MADNPYLRGLRRLAAAAGALVLSAGLVTAGSAPASADRPIRPVAVCEYRLCLLVLDPSTDSDGDGVTDVDEEALGSDPRSADSRPEAREIFDRALARRLPSFERHLTEMVALPRNNEENTGLITGIGPIPFPDRGPLFKSVEDLRNRLKLNLFDGRDTVFGGLDTNMTVMLPERPGLSDVERLNFAAGGNVALHGGKVDGRFRLEGILGLTSYGANRDKTPTSFTDLGSSFGDRGASVIRSYSVKYGGDSRDDVTSWMRQSDKSTMIDSMLTSYQGDSQSGWTRATMESMLKSEETTKSTTTTITKYDDNGKVTSSETIETKRNTDTNGDVTESFKRTTCNAEGECEVDTFCVGKKCPGGSTDGGTSTGMPNPESTSFVITAAEAMARVQIILNSTRNPVRDGDEIPIPDLPPPSGDGPAYDPMVALVNPDGVTVFAIGVTPGFNTAQPEYNPMLNGIVEAAGIHSPIHQDPLSTSWPLP